MARICTRCGYPVHEKAIFCSNCGQKIEPLSAPAQRGLPPNALKEGPPPEARQGRTGCGLTLAVLGIALATLLFILGLGGAAVYMGLADRAKAEQRFAEEHYLKGERYLQEGQYELAIAELELVLRINPNHPQARAKLDEAYRRLEVEPTATPMYQQETKEAILAAMQEAHEKGDWPRLIEQADRLLALDDSFHREEVDRLLYDAFYQMGLALVEQDRFSEALSYFDHALLLRPEDAQAKRAKEMASLYVEGLGAWGADWERAIEHLAELYQRDPNYKDVRAKLWQAYAAYGDALAEKGEWCRAKQAYQAALNVEPAPAVVEKAQKASQRCP